MIKRRGQSDAARHGCRVYRVVVVCSGLAEAARLSDYFKEALKKYVRSSSANAYLHEGIEG